MQHEEITDEQIITAAHAAMARYGRSWVRASDIHSELIVAYRSSIAYQECKKQLRGERIYYILRTRGFQRDNSGSAVRRNPKYNYIGGQDDRKSNQSEI